MYYPDYVHVTFGSQDNAHLYLYDIPLQKINVPLRLHDTQ